jgi:hypothetical protein
VVLPAALTADLLALFDSIGLDHTATAGAADEVQLTLREVVPACLGFQLDLVEQGLTVTLMSFEAPVQAADIVTSLHVPLAVLGLLRLPPAAATTPARFDPRSSLTLYGSRSGAFVDLAADLTYALTSAPGQVPALHAVTLDEHLSPPSTTSGVVGASDVSTTNRAVGYLIGEGHDPQLALEELRRRAAAAGLTAVGYAAQLLGRSTERH